MGSLFLSRNVVAEFGGRIAQILAGAPRKLDILEFAPDLKLTPEQYAGIEVTCYTRDIWEGTIKGRLSDAAMVYWSMVDIAPNLQWLQVFTAGADQIPYEPTIKRGDASLENEIGRGYLRANTGLHQSTLLLP